MVIESGRLAGLHYKFTLKRIPFTVFLPSIGGAMGWAFQLEDANIVAYLTTPNAETPEVTYFRLTSFLTGLKNEWYKTFISADKTWPERMGEKASAILNDIPQELQWNTERIDADKFKSLIEPLRESLQRYGFYALAVFDYKDKSTTDRLMAFMKNGAYASEGHGLFLISDPERQFNYQFLDPFPPIQEIAKHPGNVPGVVFFNKDASVFVSITVADDLLKRILEAAKNSKAAITDVIKTASLGPAETRILHLSDLHFGTERATALEEFLVASIARKAKDVDRIVITGDLFDNPTAEAKNAFTNFRSQLERITNKDLIVIPGNHDESFKGNRLGFIGRMFKEVATLEWSSLVIDPEMRCIFFAFDSALEAKISAQGVVTDDQLIRVGAMYQTKFDRDPDLANYLSVALIHHHPFSWSSNEPKILGYSLEDLLYLKNAQDFLEWCALKNIPLILHGHKHVPRHVVEPINVDGRWRTIQSIGCGSSLGAEDGPLSYNILSWHPQTQNWSAAFWVDNGKATGFTQRYISVSNAQSN
jgi:3',5'-cyclic AMP phosphodiesterase CpdA